MDFKITHRGKQVLLKENLVPDATLGELRASVASAVNSTPEKTRILCTGRQLTADKDGEPLHAVLPCTGAKLLVLASTSSELTAAAPPPGRTFSPPRYTATPRRTPRSGSSTGGMAFGGDSYGFGKVEVLPSLPQRERAQALLERLASDAGVLRAMKKRGWRVGALREMLPEGRVGVDPVCVLGYNVGRGSEIRLRLRTDDMRGFRGLPELMHVLAHELAHNVRDEHDNEFKEVMRQVEREMKDVDWRGAGGRFVDDGVSARAQTTADVVRDVGRGGEGGLGDSEGRRLGGGGGVSRLVEEAERRRDTGRRPGSPNENGNGRS